MDDIYETIAGLRRRGERAVLATVVGASGSAPRKEGAKMLVLADGRIMGTVGGGSLEHQVYKEALKLLEGKKPQLVHFEMTNEDASREGMLCGGTADVFIEPIRPWPVLLIFGGGHISFALARIGKMVDFRVVVIDDRPEFANAERFPEADETIAGDMASVTRRLEINGSSYIVIVTREHKNDAEVLEWAAVTPAAYVGMIGSKRKIQKVFSYLKSKGITQEQLDRVHSPIGLPIGAETPEEIAVSIMAEIIQVRRRLDATSPREQVEPL
ncbi:MAG: putative xanthine dehydrogenase subunit A [Syntrophaceae bacterium PtaU1.Bin231]|nr:MAG: putative xanthine dehydrogenase subunit A [Syntrophaceae bacterium PtaU1.Bin231]